LTPKVTAKKVSPEREQISVYLPPNMARKVQVIAAVDGISMSQAVVDLVKDGLEECDMKQYMRDFADLDDEEEEEDEEDDK
jgi:hypothetical protein